MYTNHSFQRLYTAQSPNKAFVGTRTPRTLGYPCAGRRNLRVCGLPLLSPTAVLVSYGPIWTLSPSRTPLPTPGPTTLPSSLHHGLVINSSFSESPVGLSAVNSYPTERKLERSRL